MMNVADARFCTRFPQISWKARIFPNKTISPFQISAKLLKSNKHSFRIKNFETRYISTYLSKKGNLYPEDD